MADSCLASRRPRAGRKGGENMSGVRVVTDSACDLTVEWQPSGASPSSPSPSASGTRSSSTGETCRPDEFWRRCKGTATLPETAAPSPGPPRRLRAGARRGCDGVLCITLCPRVSRPPTRAPWPGPRRWARASRSRSSTPARSPWARACSSSPPRCGRRRRLAHRARRPGRGPDPRMRVYGALDTLEHLQKGGRVGSTSALIGSLLSIKPVLGGERRHRGRGVQAANRGRSLDYLANKTRRTPRRVARRLRRRGTRPRRHAGPPRRRGSRARLVVTTLGPVVGTHAGPERWASATCWPPVLAGATANLLAMDATPVSSDTAGSSAFGADWPVKAADAVDAAVNLVVDKAVRPVIIGARAVVFGILMGVLASWSPPRSRSASSACSTSTPSRAGSGPRTRSSASCSAPSGSTFGPSDPAGRRSAATRRRERAPQGRHRRIRTGGVDGRALHGPRPALPVVIEGEPSSTSDQPGGQLMLRLTSRTSQDSPTASWAPSS